MLGHERRVGTGISTPEEHGVAVGVTVLTTYTLKEGRNIEPVPAEVDASAVIVTGAGVADDTHVTTIVCRFFTVVDATVSIEVYEFGVTGFQSFIFARCRLQDVFGDERVVYFGLVCGSLFIGFEQAVDFVSPDFADGHAFVVLRNVEIFGGVIVFRDFGDVVTQSERYAISERFAGEVEFVVPAQSQFITFGAQVGGIFFR